MKVFFKFFFYFQDWIWESRENGSEYEIPGLMRKREKEPAQRGVTLILHSLNANAAIKLSCCKVKFTFVILTQLAS